MNTTLDTIIASVGFVLCFYGMLATILLFTTGTKIMMFVGLILMGIALAHDDKIEKERRKNAKLPKYNYNR